MPEVVIEACIDSTASARAAFEGGADRLELCRALERDGLTPSLDFFSQIRAEIALPIVVMIRPHDRGYQYTEDEFASMLDDAERFVAAGSAGIVVGALTADGVIDVDRMSALVAKAAGTDVVFHRAFDEVADRGAALEALIACDVTRILTSGGARTAAEGTEVIASLQERANGRIAVLPAGSIGSQNVQQLLQQTGCTQVHGTFRSVAHPAAGTDRGTVASVRRASDRAK